MKAQTKAMILAAGRGTRLAPLTDKTPKPMLPIKGKPLIHWQLAALAGAGITEVVINTHHLGGQIESSVGDGSQWGLKVQYSRESTLLETGGGVVKALPLLDTDAFWVVNGDIWTDFDFSNLPNTPREGALAHLVLTPTPNWRARGDFEREGSWITNRGTSYCYTGIAVWSLAAFEGRQSVAFSLRDIFFQLADERKLSCQVHSGAWHDIGTLDQYEALTSSTNPLT